MIEVITPKIARKKDDYKNNILNNSNANYTRSVASIRNVIESIMVLLTGKFEKLSTKSDLQLVSHLEMELYNFAYLLNEYKQNQCKLKKKKEKKKKKTCKKPFVLLNKSTAKRCKNNKKICI